MRACACAGRARARGRTEAAQRQRRRGAGAAPGGEQSAWRAGAAAAARGHGCSDTAANATRPAAQRRIARGARGELRASTGTTAARPRRACRCRWTPRCTRACAPRPRPRPRCATPASGAHGGRKSKPACTFVAGRSAAPTRGRCGAALRQHAAGGVATRACVAGSLTRALHGFACQGRSAALRAAPGAAPPRRRAAARAPGSPVRPRAAAAPRMRLRAAPDAHPHPAPPPSPSLPRRSRRGAPRAAAAALTPELLDAAATHAQALCVPCACCCLIAFSVQKTYPRLSRRAHATRAHANALATQLPAC